MNYGGWIFGAKLEAVGKILADVLQEPSEQDKGGSFVAIEESKEQASLSVDAVVGQEGNLIDRYRLVEKIGEGGMGEVFLAQQEQPVRRLVALKIMKPGTRTPSMIARFEAERQTLARLNHPYIVRIYDAGAAPSGRRYYVMEHVNGVRITEYCQRHELTIPERLELFALVCEAIQHAHHKSVVHRDLKPGNILIVREGETAVPKVIDFGIALLLENPTHTAVSEIRHKRLQGTPVYMSPEQADIDNQDVDGRTDIYSLGVVLYEMLTGALPPGSTEPRQCGSEGTRQAVCEKTPKTSAKAPDKCLDRELGWIWLKATETDKERRYNLVSELLTDVQRYLAGLPLMAAPKSATYCAHKFIERHRWLPKTALFALVGLFAFLEVSVGYMQARRAEIGARRALKVKSERLRSIITDALGEKEAEESAAAFLAGTVESILGDREVGNLPALKNICDRISDDVENDFGIDSRAEVVIHYRLGISYLAIGDYEAAASHLETALYLVSVAFPDESLRMRSCMLGLGLAYLVEGDSRKAIALFSREAKLAEAQDEEPEFVEASVLHNFQLWYTDKGQYWSLHLRYAGCDMLSENDPKSMARLPTLAMSYLADNHHDNAELLFFEALRKLSSLTSESSIFTVTARQNLAMFYVAKGKYKEAYVVMKWRPLWTSPAAMGERCESIPFHIAEEKALN